MVFPGEAFGLAAGLFFALTEIFTRKALDNGAEPSQAVTAQLLVQVPVFGLPLALGLGGMALPAVIPWQVILLFVAGGFLGTGLGRQLNYRALALIGPSRTVSLRMTTPLFALLIGWLALGEMLRSLELVGIALIVAGLLLVVREKELVQRFSPTIAGAEAAVAAELPAGKARLGGVVLALISALAFAVSDVMRRYGMLLVPSPFLAGLIGTIGALAVQAALFAGAGARPGGRGRPFWAAPARSAIYLLLSSLSVSAALLSVLIALNLIPAAKATVLYSTSVLWVPVLARPLMGVQEPITLWLWLAAVATLVGVALMFLF